MRLAWLELAFDPWRSVTDPTIGEGQARPPQILWAERDLGLATCGSVCVAVWRGPVTHELHLRQAGALESLVQRYPGRVGFVCVVEQNAPPPSPELRRASVEMITRLGRRLSCTACVIEGSGFSGAVARSVLAGMALLLPSSTAPFKFTATVAGAAAWIAEDCEDVSEAAIILARELLRQRMDLGDIPAQG